ncbi:MAG: zinc ribbon domain-containing protein [Clostridia bacterium]|nr:zinc ribbon domain-containing protein [Clostridia bacterium]
MAIIKCPHCGNNVSDTASNCIHCGESLTGEEKPKVNCVNYNNLLQSEQSALKNEFYESYPQYKKYEDKEAMLKKLIRIDWIFIILGLVLILPGLFYANGDNFDLNTLKTLSSLSTIGLILFFASDALEILSRFILRSYKKKILLATKKYQKWLKVNKNINYNVTFIGKDAKWKKYFDEINVDMEG